MNPFMLLAPAKAIFSRVPALVWLAAALAFWGWLGHHQARVVATERDQALQQANSALAEAKQERENRDAERKIDAGRILAAETQASQAKRDKELAVAAAATADRVLKRVAALVEAGRSGSGATAVPGSTPADLLGGAFAACLVEYRALGEDAADAIRRGERCINEYRPLETRKATP